MSLDLTPNQLHQIESLGIDLSPQKKANLPIVPLLSISGLTIVSFGGIFLLKSRLSAIESPAPVLPVYNSERAKRVEGPTQVPKSIQHYLLTSQQYFTQALQAQSTCKGNPGGCPSAVESLNQSILAASDAIKEFPDDFRGYEQRGRIYQSLINSQLASSKPSGEGGPQQFPFLANAIADFSAAATRNPDSATLTRALATLYGQKGDSQATLTYLTRTINLDPTIAQNFYDLARIQQQVGLLPQALSTYDRLLTIVSDPAQKQAVTTEKSALEKLVAQNPAVRVDPRIDPSPAPSVPVNPDGPLIQADAGNTTGLIIAAPETSTKVTVSNLSTSNALAGDATLSAGQTKITLENSSLTASAQVYISLVSGGKNKNLRLLSRSPDSFTVGLDSPSTDDIVFKWWIVK